MTTHTQTDRTVVDSSTFRVHARFDGGSGRQNTRLRLFDIETEQAVWASVASGCFGQQGHSSVWPGTLLDGVVSGGRGEGVFTVESATVHKQATLAVGAVETPLPQYVWDSWRTRTRGQRRVATVGPDGHCEVHVSALPDSVAYDTVWAQMLDGEYSFEPWFDGLVELDVPAQHLTVVAPADRELFVFFGTPATAPVETVRRRRERLELPVFPPG